MIASEFLDQIQKLRGADYASFEDFADKFNFIFTTLVLMVCTMVVTAKQYMLKPIACYMATNIGGKNLLDYVENYCWVQGTIPISFYDNIPNTDERWLEINDKKICELIDRMMIYILRIYYQWVPFVLGLQTISFYVPRIFWQIICQNKSGSDMMQIMALAREMVNSTDRQAKIIQIADIISAKLRQSESHAQGNLQRVKKFVKNSSLVIFSNKKTGGFLFSMYLVVKILYLANAVGQIFLLESFLGFNQMENRSAIFGYEIAQNIASGSDNDVFPIFPKIGFCLSKINQAGATNYVAAQCVLPVNMLNERIYAFLWFWFCINASLTLVSIPIWLMSVYSEKSQLDMIEDYLEYQDVDLNSDQDKKNLAKFIKTFLRNDGVFIIRMIAQNSDSQLCSEIVFQMWKTFNEKHSQCSIIKPTAPEKLPSETVVKPKNENFDLENLEPRTPLTTNDASGIVI